MRSWGKRLRRFRGRGGRVRSGTRTRTRTGWLGEWDMERHDLVEVEIDDSCGGDDGCGYGF